MIVIASAELFVEQTWLDVTIVLVLAGTVFADLANQRVVDDLADLDAWIDSNRLYSKHLQRPIAFETDIAETRSHVDKKPQSPQGTSSFDHRYEIVSFGVFDRSAQIDLVRTEYQSGFRNLDPPISVGLFDVQHHLFVHQQLVVKSQVVAIRVQLIGIEGINLKVGTKSLLNLFAGKDHFRLERVNDRSKSGGIPVR